MSETVYIETSILGYLTARQTKNLIVAANIEVTRDWWEYRSSDFTLYISQAVLNETAQGDTEISAQRLEIVRNYSIIGIEPGCTRFGNTIPLPQQSPQKS